MNEFIIHGGPTLSPFAAPWATFGVPLWQLIEDIRENKNGMLDLLEQLSIAREGEQTKEGARRCHAELQEGKSQEGYSPLPDQNYIALPGHSQERSTHETETQV